MADLWYSRALPAPLTRGLCGREDSVCTAAALEGVVCSNLAGSSSLRSWVAVITIKESRVKTWVLPTFLRPTHPFLAACPQQTPASPVDLFTSIYNPSIHHPLTMHACMHPSTQITIHFSSIPLSLHPSIIGMHNPSIHLSIHFHLSTL